MTARPSEFPATGWLHRFWVREDPVYDGYASRYQAKSASAKAIYLLLYLLPGALAYFLCNVEPVFDAVARLSGLSPRNLQYVLFVIVTFGWHMLTPFLILRYSDKLTLRQSCQFLGFDRVDWRGLFVVLPVYCVLFALVSVPYMRFVWRPLWIWLKSVPAFQIPSYSIFQENLYSVPPLLLAVLFIGNFLGEELYFRGYLMKKTAFLGRANWIINSVLMSLYHFWQIPQTWPLTGLVLAFGLLMELRKDLYVLVAFHFFVNMWLSFGEWKLEQWLRLG
jgi:membrane protease YdiL (CAAX protease family)